MLSTVAGKQSAASGRLSSLKAAYGVLEIILNDLGFILLWFSRLMVVFRGLLMEIKL